MKLFEIDREDFVINAEIGRLEDMRVDNLTIGKPSNDVGVRIPVNYAITLVVNEKTYTGSLRLRRPRSSTVYGDFAWVLYIAKPIEVGYFHQAMRVGNDSLAELREFVKRVTKRIESGDTSHSYMQSWK